MSPTSHTASVLSAPRITALPIRSGLSNAANGTLTRSHFPPPFFPVPNLALKFTCVVMHSSSLTMSRYSFPALASSPGLTSM